MLNPSGRYDSNGRAGGGRYGRSSEEARTPVQTDRASESGPPANGATGWSQSALTHWNAMQRGRDREARTWGDGADSIRDGQKSREANAEGDP